MADTNKKNLSKYLNSIVGGLRPEPEFKNFTFENLEPADTIIVTTNLNVKHKTIDDPETIQAVLTFIKGHADGWVVPLEGVPVARLRLNFYVGRKILGNLGVGRTFLSVHQFGNFWAKASTETDRFRLLEIIEGQDND